MTRTIGRLLIRLTARLVPQPLRAQWQEEWLGELHAIPTSRDQLRFVAGAPWDAASSRWTMQRRLVARLWPAQSEWRQSLRSLSRAPGFSFAAIGVVALGIALATTIFAVVDGVLFKPLPYPEPHRLFGVIENAWPGNGRPETASPSPAQLEAWREALPDVQFSAYAGLRHPNFILKTGARAEQLTHVMVGEGFWDTLGLAPLFGSFTAADFEAKARVPAAVISHDLWQRWCGGNPAAVGRSILDDGGSGVRVVGVLPKNFTSPWGFQADVVTPLVSVPASHDRGSAVLVRIPIGVTEEDIANRVSAVNASLAPSWPVSPSLSPTLRHRSLPIGDVTLSPLKYALTAETRMTSWLVLGLALCLLALGCVNVAGLATARLQDQWRALVLRRALGAGLWDLVRVLMTESALIVGCGATVGFLLAAPLLSLTLGLLSDPMLFLKRPALDWRVLSFAAMAAGSAVLVITAAAAGQLVKVQVAPALGHGPTMSRRGRLSAWLSVSGQVAMACVLTVLGALVTGSLARARGEDPGFDLMHAARIPVTPPRNATAADIEQLMSDLRRQPGIAAAGGLAGSLVDGISFIGSDFTAPSNVPVPPLGVPHGTVGVVLQSVRVTQGYLQAAGLRLIDGRLPTAEEFQVGTPVLVVSESVAHGYWPGQRALGQTLISNEYMSGPSRPFTVIGVVADARYAALDRDAHGAIYYPNAATPRPWLGSVLLRLDASDPPSLEGVGIWLQKRCPQCTIYGQPALMADLMSTSILPRTFRAWLFASFGLASLAIVGAGLFGLVVMTSNRRTKEIGIRLALGAPREAVVWQMLREQISGVVAGLLVGSLVAAWAVQFVKSYLYKLTLYDSATWLVAIGALLTVSTLGALIPSVRASRLDPVRALRVE